MAPSKESRATRSGLAPTLLYVAFLIAGAHLAHADTNGWISHGPYGVQVNLLAIDPTTPSTIYADIGYGGVFQSTNSGGSWSAVNSGLPSNIVNSGVALAIDSTTTPSTLYLGVGKRVYRSTLSGASWSAVGSLPLNENINVLVIDPTTPSTLYIGTLEGGVFQSTNSGASWSAVNSGLPLGSAVIALAINRATASTLYAVTYQGGVFQSTNSGGSWSAVNSGLPLGQVEFTMLAIDPTTPSTLYAGTYQGGVFQSTNSGGSWSAVNSGLPSYVGVYSMAIDPTTPGTLYAGTDGGVYQSTNSGGSWSSLASDVGVTAVVVDPITPSTLYVGTFQGGVFQSTNSGGSWSAVDRGLKSFVLEVNTLAVDPTTPSTLYAGTNGGVYQSINNGGSWKAVNAGLSGAGISINVTALVISPITPSTLYAITGGGVFKTTNSGTSWSALSNVYSVNSLAIDPTTPSTLYAATTGGQGLFYGGVFESTDSGASWTAINYGLPSNASGDYDIRQVAIDPSTPSTLYVIIPDEADSYDSVYQSSDSGASWSAVNGSSRLYNFLNALAIDPTTPSTLYAGTYSGVFKSTDSGANWTAANSGLPPSAQSGNLHATALAISPLTPSTLYVAADSVLPVQGGVYQSTDSGGSWVNIGLPAKHYVSALAINPTIAVPEIYAGTIDAGGPTAGGVFRELSADAVVLAPSPLNITIPSGSTEVDKILRVRAFNAGSSPWLIQLDIDASQCPAGSVGPADFGNGTNSILVAAGKTAKATIPLIIKSGAFTSFNFKAPTRCSLMLNASLVGSSDPSPANNQAAVELNVVNKNAPQQTTTHETTVKSVRPKTMTIARGATTATKKLTAAVGNADYLPTRENPGDAITLQASTSCSGLTLSTPVCDATADSATVAVRGGATHTCRFTATADSAHIITPTKLSPQRCTVTLTAIGPSNPEAPPLDPSNDTTHLTIDITDKNDF